MAGPRTYLPSDPLFPVQWHLLNTGNTINSVPGFDINVISVWPEYTGKGILVGVLDDGMDNTHPDLVANYRSDLAWDVDLNVPGATVRVHDDMHGVAVAGLIAASAGNGIGGVGVAFNSTFTMHRLELNNTSNERLLKSYELSALKMVEAGVDISSNSWGPGAILSQEGSEAFHAPSRYMAEFGRDGLGIVSLFAGGNDRVEHMNTNYDPTDNSPWSIIVAASTQDGDISSYSTRGASLLITSTGSGMPGDVGNTIVTTDRQSVEGYNPTEGEAGNYVYRFNGTSAATPIAAGVVALILEANDGLGYRDVQEILAYSASRASYLTRDVDLAYNGSNDWNGGALLGSHDFGYGNIDAHAAVRLAESWTKLGTVSNLVFVDGAVTPGTVAVAPGGEGTATASFAPDHRVEQILVTVKIGIPEASVDGLTLELVSPSGTVSTLADFPPPDAEDHDAAPNEGDQEFHYTFTTARHWGESLAGEWMLRLKNESSPQTFDLREWSIQAFTAGDATASKTQIFTNEFGLFAALDEARTHIDSQNGSHLNAAAVTDDVRFDLTSGYAAIGDTRLTLEGTQGFRSLFSGDGNDILIGNAAGNLLMAGRGDNHVDGAGGVDVARFISSFENYTVAGTGNMVWVESREALGHGIDVLYNVEILQFGDRVVLSEIPVNLGTDLFDERGYLNQNPDVAQAILAGQLTSGREHYTHWGVKEGRNPNVLFDETWYLATNADVANAVAEGRLASGFDHYQHWGWAESRSPAAWMDSTAYLEDNPDVAAAGVNPLLHYLLYGINESRTLTAHDAHVWL